MAAGSKYLALLRGSASLSHKSPIFGGNQRRADRPLSNKHPELAKHSV